MNKKNELIIPKQNPIEQPKANRSVIRETAMKHGPGSELHNLIPAFLSSQGCGCKNFAAKMNMWGPDGCEKNKKDIVDHLVKQSKKRAMFSWMPESATKKVAEKLVDTAIKRARGRSQDPNTKWFCAVTTAPRQISTLRTSLDSMKIAGFEPFIFAEPGSDIPVDYSEAVILHRKRLGVWHNWLFSLRYAIDNTDANIIMTVQDDTLFHPDSKEFIENILWPHDQVGFISLYTPKHYNTKPRSKNERPAGINKIITKSLWGACALVWPRKVAEEMLKQPLIKSWIGASTKTKNSSIMQKRRENPALVQNSDTAIGKLMNRMKRTMWFADPSPVRHIAPVSSDNVNHGGNDGRRNCGRCAKWSEPLADQIPLLTNGKELPPRVDYDNIII